MCEANPPNWWLHHTRRSVIWCLEAMISYLSSLPLLCPAVHTWPQPPPRSPRAALPACPTCGNTDRKIRQKQVLINTEAWTLMAAIFQTPFWNGFYWMKMLQLRFKCQWRLFLKVLFTVSQHYPDSKVHGAIMGPPGSCRPQVGPMLAPWILLSG